LAAAHPNIRLLETRLGASWLEIENAGKRTLAERESLKAALPANFPADTSLVVFGSLARGEMTAKSDVDWTLLVDGQAYANHLATVREIESALRKLGHTPPGRENIFGGLAFSHDLVHFIGGPDDTNANTTRRLLLLLESAAIGDSAARERVIRQLLARYVHEDVGVALGRNEVPRFLLNDVVRYWRTLAVDFAYKRSTRNAAGWALRTVKLRLSRKLTYAAGMLCCFEAAKVLRNPDIKDKGPNVVTDLLTRLQDPPLELLARSLYPYLDDPLIQSACKDIFESYDAFLGILNSDDKRLELEKLQQDKIEGNATYDFARGLGHRFQDGLTKVFLNPNSTPFPDLTYKYGVF
jgi:predicted nucleotidyltransferase